MIDVSSCHSALFEDSGDVAAVIGDGGNTVSQRAEGVVQVSWPDGAFLSFWFAARAPSVPSHLCVSPCCNPKATGIYRCPRVSSYHEMGKLNPACSNNGSFLFHFLMRHIAKRKTRNKPTVRTTTAGILSLKIIRFMRTVLIQPNYDLRLIV